MTQRELTERRVYKSRKFGWSGTDLHHNRSSRRTPEAFSIPSRYTITSCRCKVPGSVTWRGFRDFMSVSCVVLVFCLSGASLHKDDANKRTKKIRKRSVSQNRGSSTATCLWYIPFYCIFFNKTPTFPVPKHPKSC